MNKHTAELFEAYEYGLNYGLYLAEMERISEGIYDAVLCGEYSRKMNRPSAPAQRRQPRSEEWQIAMGAGFMQFIKLGNILPLL